MTSGKDDIIMVSKSGHATRFNEKQARPMGRGTAGVKGMNVSDKGNEVLSLDVVDSKDSKGELLVVTENGYGKRTSLTEYPVKGRGGEGRADREADRQEGRPRRRPRRPRGPGADLHLPERDGAAQRRVGGISRMGRPTQGVRVMNLKKGDRVSAVALVVESETRTATVRRRPGPLSRTRRRRRPPLAEEAAAAEAAGNGEAKVTKAPRRRSSGSKTPRQAEVKAGAEEAGLGRGACRGEAKGRPSPKRKREAQPGRRRSRSARRRPKQRKREAASPA